MSKKDNKKGADEGSLEMIPGHLPGDSCVRWRRKRVASIRRTLGVTEIFSIAYGNLGSSIYYALGVTAIYAMGATPLVFVLAALLFIFTAASYAEGTAAIPEAGGSSSFARKAFNELVSFFAGWCLLLGYIVTIAIAAFAAIGYLAYLDYFNFLQLSPWNVIGTGILLLFLMIINVIGTRSSVVFSVILTMIDIITLTFLVIMAMFLFLNMPDLISRIHLGVVPTWNQLLTSFFIVMISFTGIETISNMAGDSRDPGTTIPRSIWWSMGTVLVMFFLISSVALSAMPVEYRIRGYIYSVPVANSSNEFNDTDQRLEKLVYYKNVDSGTRGKPVGGVIIKVSEIRKNPKERPTIKRVMTDSDGRFTVKEIGFGPHNFKIYKKGFKEIEFPFDTSKPTKVPLAGKWSTDLVERWKNDPVAGIADAVSRKIPILKEPLKIWVSLLAFTVLIIAANAGILAVSRLIFSMGTYNQIPPILATVHRKFRTPYVAIIVFTVIAFLIVLPGNMEDIAYVYAFAALISYTIAHVSIIAMRIKYPDMERPYKIPFNIKIGGREIPITAIIGGLVTFTIWVMVAYQKEVGRVVGVPFILIGLVIYWFYRRHRGMSLTETEKIKKK